MTSSTLTDWHSQISALFGANTANQSTATRMLAPGLLFLTIALAAIAIAVPATADILMLGLIILLPITGLIALKPILMLLLCFWLVDGASALIAASQATDLSLAIIHSSTSIYLYVVFFILAAFIAKRPAAHTSLVMQAYVCTAILSSLAVLLGLVELVPSTDQPSAGFDRAAGGLASSSLFGAFLVPALLYALHLMVARPLTNAIAPACIFVLLGYAILINSWPDAGVNLAIAGTAFVFFAFTTSPTQVQRLKLILIVSLGLVVLAGVMVISAQQPQTSQVLAERAKAVQVNEADNAKRSEAYSNTARAISLNPLGRGAGELGEHNGREHPHNVYLNMMLHSGWIGGLIFMAITLLTVTAGFAHAIKPSQLQPMIIIAYSVFLGLAAQGLTADLEHWRHYYLVMAILWGLIASNGPNFAFDEQAVDADDEIKYRQERVPTIMGPGRRTIAARKPEERRDRSHHPRRPQSMAYT